MLLLQQLIYIYIYIERERERERALFTIHVLVVHKYIPQFGSSSPSLFVHVCVCVSSESNGALHDYCLYKTMVKSATLQMKEKS
jgi:hypothetical protein